MLFKVIGDMAGILPLKREEKSKRNKEKAPGAVSGRVGAGFCACSSGTIYGAKGEDMFKRIVMVLAIVVGAGFPRPNDERGSGDLVPTGIAFAELTQDQCPPECVTDCYEYHFFYRG